ncbi:MAG TPA: hypothetical protein PKC39_07815 [Ferruginibacter sp.]|nr:hypothetical protein [Ferruginibacter sp.]HMP20849.1 hypothetical protein [Ferruginibacter sp.]
MNTIYSIKLYVFICLLAPLAAWAQKNLQPSDSIIISGSITNETVIPLASLSKFITHEIGDFVVTNHLGEKKSTLKGLKGVLLKELLAGVDITVESPKQLSEFYFVFAATDGYKVVYSWNEIFNNPAGNNIFVVTEKEGIKATVMSERILMLNSADEKTGRRLIKALQRIEVRRAL